MVKIKTYVTDISYGYTKMYRLNINLNPDTDENRSNVHKFLEDNYDDFDCLKLGRIYFLQNIEYLEMAFKLGWDQIEGDDEC